MGDSQYSFSLTTFSPTGKLVQIEHALTAVGSGQTSLGIKAANGVVIATEKKLPSILVDESSVQKIQNLTPNIGVVYSGMGPDFRVLVRKSRKQAEQYHRLYKEPIPVTQLVRETAAVMQEFTQSGGVRPFGVSLLVAGFDDKGPQLYQVDPSGSYFSWKASAMGKNVSNAKTFLEKRYTDDMELDDAVHTAILTLKEGFEGQISGKNIEIGIIGADKQFRHALSEPISFLSLVMVSCNFDFRMSSPIIKDLKYAESHEWVKVAGNTATVGITDHAQDHLGDVVYVELPEVGATVNQGSGFGAVESVKATSDVYSPVSGNVVEVNEELSNSPGLVNSSPYEKGWIMKVEIKDAGELETLKNSDDYAKFCEEEDAKH
ncbi:proteasome subunit alpha type-2-A isoform X1 [Populus alba x Populus x berolinensis]|nr:proteasome subunit alpha type-2-A isoform X1 [Populus alba x Populus x berolinensis]KAJ6971039.1 proteasome subunit alpha type-2-A isoform X1 [Populus alba x Populus x berolinensis]